MSNPPQIYAVVITYIPDELTLIPLLEQLQKQTTHVIVVDNTAKADNRLAQQFRTSSLDHAHFSLIRLGDNLGIATALNIGIEVARDEGAEFVLLSDQDSLPANDMISGLFNTYKQLTDSGINVGAVGPTFTDNHTCITHSFQADIPGKFFYGHSTPSIEHPHIEAITLITSGTLIPIDVLNDVGNMREDFFIDHVDIEWCHRARAKDYRLFGTGSAHMAQRMGESKLRLWFFGWQNESIYNPLRIYYRLRNYVAMTKLDYINWRWKVRSGLYWAKIVYAHVIFGPNKTKSLTMAIKGIWHGLHRRMGRG